MANWTEYQAAMPAHILIRFGRWEEILELELPQDNKLLYITTAIIRYARGLALSALRRVKEAEVARAEFKAARRAVPKNRQYGIACRAEIAL